MHASSATVLLFACAACSEPAPSERTEITVFAASSISEALEDAGRTFAQNHPVDVRFSFAGSQILRRQIEQGAPADVFVAASMEHVRGDIARELESPHELICNEPVLVVASNSPIRSLRDLPNAERLVLGVPEVPIGAYSDRILREAARLYGDDFEARVRARIVSRELDVRQVLARIAQGEADAVIVYRSDVQAAGSHARAIDIPSEIRVIAHYPIAVLQRTHTRDEARSFVDFMRSDEGQSILVRHGFARCMSTQREDSTPAL